MNSNLAVVKSKGILDQATLNANVTNNYQRLTTKAVPALTELIDPCFTTT